MKLCDAAEWAGSRYKLAKLLNLTPQAVYAWGDEVPELYAYRLERLSGGRLKAPEPKPMESPKRET